MRNQNNQSCIIVYPWLTSKWFCLDTLLYICLQKVLHIEYGAHFSAEWIRQCFYSPSLWTLKPTFKPPSCWPQTQTACRAWRSPACRTARISWRGCSRPRSPAPGLSHCGRQEQSRPGSRLSWRCPCTSEPALRTWRAERYSISIYKTPTGPTCFCATIPPLKCKFILVGKILVLWVCLYL